MQYFTNLLYGLCYTLFYKIKVYHSQAFKAYDIDIKQKLATFSMSLTK